ncbi:PIN domain-containing protein [Limibacter armeniacum]|uniref:PIN domain-containing protein n=1 Tax=Limibacter armeniacum TaxID=466084 RepID=UPI002FE5D8E0
MKKYIFIDFENVQSLPTKLINTELEEVVLLLGGHQNKIPLELVQKLQPLGDKVKWIQINTAGRNNLDFHLSFLLGQYHHRADKTAAFIIISKDKGFDGLITYIQQMGRTCYRQTHTLEFTEFHNGGTLIRTGEPIYIDAEKFQRITTFQRVMDTLKNLHGKNRPRKEKTLLNYISSLIRHDNTDCEPTDILQLLAENKKISIESGKVTYFF